MKIADIERAVIACVSSNVEMANGTGIKVTAATVPMKEIDGFDSMRALEVLVELETQLKIALTPEEVFVPNGAQSVAEIAQAIYKCVEGKK